MNVEATYTAVLYAIDLIGQAKTETEACAEARITVSRFRATVQKHTELIAMFTDAEARGYDRMADELANIHKWGDDNGVTDAKMLKIVSDNRKWLLAKRKPLQYGERSVVEHNITADRAVIEALSRGKQHALQGKIVEDVAYRIVKDVTPALPGPAVELDPEYAQFA